MRKRKICHFLLAFALVSAIQPLSGAGAPCGASLSSYRGSRPIRTETSRVLLRVAPRKGVFTDASLTRWSSRGVFSRRHRAFLPKNGKAILKTTWVRRLIAGSYRIGTVPEPRLHPTTSLCSKSYLASLGSLTWV